MSTGTKRRSTSSGVTYRRRMQHRPRARRAVERERAAHGAADRDDLDLTRRTDEVDDPARDRLVQEHVADRCAQRCDLLQADDGREPAERMAAELLVHDLSLVLRVGVAERGLHEEAIELRLRERECPLVLDRVLRRHDEEGIAERARLAVHGHLLLGHRLEQHEGLHLRHRAVDLVHEDDVREHRPGPELEVALALVEDREAGDVGRLEIRRALDARHLGAADRSGDRAREHRLRRAGNVLQEGVPAAHERGHDELDLLSLAVHHRLDVVQQAFGDLIRHSQIVSSQGKTSRRKPTLGP